MENKDNLKHVLIQFANATGIKGLTINNVIHNSEIKSSLLRFIMDKKMASNRFIDFIYDMNADVLERTTAEVGKRECDSVTVPFDTTIISPYEYKEVEDKERIIPARLVVWDEKPVIYFKTSTLRSMYILPEKRIETLMTSNPDTLTEIANWDGLHNSGNFNIMVGIYGYLYDKDKETKLQILKTIKEKLLDNDYIFDYNTINDIYLAAITSDREKKLRKVKTR